MDRSLFHSGDLLRHCRIAAHHRSSFNARNGFVPPEAQDEEIPILPDRPGSGVVRDHVGHVFDEDNAMLVAE